MDAGLGAVIGAIIIGLCGAAAYFGRQYDNGNAMAIAIKFDVAVLDELLCELVKKNEFGKDFYDLYPQPQSAEYPQRQNVDVRKEDYFVIFDQAVGMLGHLNSSWMPFYISERQEDFIGHTVSFYLNLKFSRVLFAFLLIANPGDAPEIRDRVRQAIQKARDHADKLSRIDVGPVRGKSIWSVSRKF